MPWLPKQRRIPTMNEIYKLKPAAIASYLVVAWTLRSRLGNRRIVMLEPRR